MGRSDFITQIARAVSDGGPISWDDLARSHPEMRRRLQALRSLDNLAVSSRRRLAEIIDAPGASSAAASDADPAEPLTTWGPLQLRERVGAGSFGEVYRAFDPVLERDVALKLAHEPVSSDGVAWDHHLEEARRLARVRHPNVLAIHGAEVHAGRAGIWTDFLRGETLEERLRGTPAPIAAEELARLGTDLCHALSAVHSVGLVHADVKAANVMCERSGRTVLMDFGAGGTLLPLPGSRAPRAGTPLVMAPECLRGEPPTVASDLYSLGVLLYRLATRLYPVRAQTRAQLLAEHRRGRRIAAGELRPDLPPELAWVIDHALEPDPGARFDSASAMAHALAASIGSSPAGLPSDSGAESPSLPVEPDRFIGRREELAESRRRLLRNPVLTLLGPGGVGKTRLALRLARESAGAYRDGVCWVDLASAGQEGAILPVLAQALGLTVDPRRSLGEVVVAYLSTRSMLLVLDNCEHLLGECRALIRRLRAAGSDLRFLATSREPLGIDGEERLLVPALSAPPAARVTRSRPEADLLVYDAIRFFLDRAHLNWPGFRLTEANTAAVTEICRRCEGLPLALELAAARLDVLSPEEIAGRLPTGLPPKPGTGRRRAPRQATIEASVDWSYRLLREPERVLLRRLAVFARHWTLEAMDETCRDEGASEPTIQGELILDLASSLVNRSLLARDRGPQLPAVEIPAGAAGASDTTGAAAAAEPPISAFSVLEAVRAFARARLEESGELPDVQRRHLDYRFRLARRAGAGLVGAAEAYWVRRLEWEQESFLGVLRWSGATGQEIDTAMRIATELRRFWYARGWHALVVEVTAGLLGASGLSGQIRGRGLIALATSATALGDHDRAIAACEESLAILRADGHEAEASVALGVLATIHANLGQTDRSVSLWEETVESRRAHLGPAWVAPALCNLGVAYAFQSRLDRARTAYEEALALFDSCGNRREAATVAANLAATALDLGDLAAARSWADDAMSRLRGVGEELDRSAVLFVQGAVAREEGDLRTSRSLLLEGLQRSAGRGDLDWATRGLAEIACTCVREGDPERATRLFGAVAAHREDHPGAIDPCFARRLERYRAAAIDRLGAERGEDLTALGRALSLEQAMVLAGADLSAPPSN